VPWEELLYRFFSDLAHTAISWARPNRRYTDIYLPSRFLDQGRLEKLNYYLDVSGSTSDDDVLRFNSEVKHIKEEFKPKALDLVQFDTRIQQYRHFDEEDAFDEIEIVGRGGTDLEPVRKHIIETEPTAAIVFSDMQCAPMRELPFEIPIIWIVVGRGGHKPNFGDVIRIKG
jgi:predicted metal-dependent peptidase